MQSENDALAAWLQTVLRREMENDQEVNGETRRITSVELCSRTGRVELQMSRHGKRPVAFRIQVTSRRAEL